MQATIVVSTISAWQLFRIGSGHPGECFRSLKENKEHAATVTVSTSATVSVLVQMLRIQLYSTVAFSFVVFTCWSFGYAYMAGWRSSPNVASMSMSSSTLLGYIFATLNVLQGIYLFSYHCLRNGQVSRYKGSGNAPLPQGRVIVLTENRIVEVARINMAIVEKNKWCGHCRHYIF